MALPTDIVSAASALPPLPDSPAIRPATVGDIDALLELETRSFDTDRLTRRNFQYLLTRAHAACLLAEDKKGHLLGYVLALFRRGTSLARIYSLAVAASARGQGVGQALLLAAEQAAIEEHAWLMRLEVRPDNQAAHRLYEAAGYRPFGRYLDYYEDHSEAVRYQKRLRPYVVPPETRVPYYSQTTDFTCGPAALMMAMKALDPATELGQRLELQLWREATSIFMASGHGGCGPYGIALAAHRRGFKVDLYVSSAAPFFLDTVRSAEKKRVIQLVSDEFAAQMAETDIVLHSHALTLEEMTVALDTGALPIVLISLYRMYRENVPHWIVVHAQDERFIYAHDPLVDPDHLDLISDKANMPIPKTEFETMARFGRNDLRAAIVLKRREQTDS